MHNELFHKVGYVGHATGYWLDERNLILGREWIFFIVITC
jgi:hypothetical protein